MSALVIFGATTEVSSIFPGGDIDVPVFCGEADVYLCEDRVTAAALFCNCFSLLWVVQ